MPWSSSSGIWVTKKTPYIGKENPGAAAEPGIETLGDGTLGVALTLLHDVRSRQVDVARREFVGHIESVRQVRIEVLAGRHVLVLHIGDGHRNVLRKLLALQRSDGRLQRHRDQTG